MGTSRCLTSLAVCQSANVLFCSVLQVPPLQSEHTYIHRLLVQPFQTGKCLFFSAVSVWEWLGLWCLSHFQQYFSYIVAVSLIGGGNQRKPPQVTDKLYHMYRLYLARVGFELTTLVVVGSDCIGSGKSNYHTITTRMAPLIIRTDVLIGMSYFSCLSKRHIQPFWADKYLFFCCFCMTVVS